MLTIFIKDEFGNKLEFTNDAKYSPDVADDMVRRTLDLYKGTIHTQNETRAVSALEEVSDEGD